MAAEKISLYNLAGTSHPPEGQLHSQAAQYRDIPLNP